MSIQSKMVTLMLLAIFGGFAVVAAQAQEYDVVILNGRVMDPETKYDDIANVGIKDGKITGKETIDATGHVVAPGFIDIHAHGQNIGDYRHYSLLLLSLETISCRTNLSTCNLLRNLPKIVILQP